MVMEYCSGGDFFELAKTCHVNRKKHGGPPFSVHAVRMWAAQLVACLEYAHTSKPQSPTVFKLISLFVIIDTYTAKDTFIGI